MDDNFFELGGDSLSAVTLLLQIEEKLGLSDNRPEFGDLYRYPTPALLLERISQGADSGGTEFDIAHLDYEGMEEYLAAHTHKEVKRKYLGNVLLTGVTGFLGIHILVDLLRNPDWSGKIVCLSRPKKTLSALKRVKSSAGTGKIGRASCRERG